METTEQRLVRENIKFLYFMAHKVKPRAKNVPLEDLVQVGAVAMMQAARTYNPALGYKFITYAVMPVRTAMLQLARANHSVVKVGTTRKQRMAFERISQCENAEDLATHTGMSAHQATDFWATLHAPYVSLNARVAETHTEHQDMLADENDLEAVVERKQLVAKLTEAMKSLNHREQNIIIRWLNDETHANIARDYGVSRERVRQIQARAMKKLRKVLGHELQLAG